MCEVYNSKKHYNTIPTIGLNTPDPITRFTKFYYIFLVFARN